VAGAAGRVSRRARAALLAATALAFLVRLALLLAYDEAPGDGPARAALGYRWFETGRASFHGHWLPGHEVMVGLVLHLVRDPAWAGRLLSLAAGTAAVPLLHALTRRVLASDRAAALAAFLLALNPMHAALSATTLGEVPALTALLALTLACLRLADAPGRPGPWAAAAAAALAGCSIRYEVWPALPVLALHHLLRTRSLWRATLLGAVLGAFPLLWLAERARLLGAGLLASYSSTIAGAGTIGARPVDLPAGALALADGLAAQLGAPLLWLAALGLVAAAALRRSLDLAAFAALLAAEAALLAKLAADLGDAFWPRYPLTLAVLLLPPAAFALAACLRPPVARHAVSLAAGVAMLHAAWSRGLYLYLVPEIPAATRAAAAWVAARPADEPLLLTRMGWQATYVPVLARLPWDRYRVVSTWLPDAELRRFVRYRDPRYVVTRAGDVDLLERLCQVAGVAARPDRPLAVFGPVAVLELDPEGCAAAAATPP
jgi:hypothetical protein